MNDHNLDDLIIGSVAPSNNKAKSLLTIIALLIVVMIVAIVLTKILLKTPENEHLEFEENMTEMIAPELKLQEESKEPEVKEEPSLSSMINAEMPAPEANNSSATQENESNSSTPDEDFAPDTSSESSTATKNAEPNETHEASTAANSEGDIREAEEGLDEAVEITDEYAQESSPVKKAAPKTVTPPPEKPKQAKPKPAKNVVEEEVSEPEVEVEKPAKKEVAPTPKTEGTYFIQVGSFTSEPSARFLSSVKNSGFNYSITSGGKDGSRKLLVGPYSSQEDAQSALTNVKDRINKSAFVIKK